MNMDPGEMELYMKMLEHGQISTYNIRLMFVGLYGAGKTCTARRIMGKEIDDVSSTDGIDVYIGKCRVDVRNNEWETVDGKKSIFLVLGLFCFWDINLFLDLKQNKLIKKVLLYRR